MKIKKKIRTKVIVDYILVSLLLISSTSSTSALSQSLSFITGSFVLTLFVAYRRNILIDRNIKYILWIVFLYYIFYLFKFHSYNPKFTYRVVLFLLYSYITIRILNFRFFELLVNIIFFLSLISLPLYILQLVFFNKVYNIIETIQANTPFLEKEIIKTVNIIIWGVQSKGAEFRNCGFMWEPGAFAAMLLLPIMFELSINKFKITKKVIILIIALLTTFSTMGYVGLLIIIIWVLYNSNVKHILLLTPVIIIVFYYIIQLPFMQEKVISEYSNVDMTIKKSIRSNYEHASFGRMGSAIMDLKDLRRSILLGIGGQQEEMSFYKSGPQKWINRTNGLSNYLLTFGIIGLLLLLYNLNKTFKILQKYFKYKGRVYFTIIILVLSFSNGLLITPLFFVYQIFYIATVKKQFMFK